MKVYVTRHGQIDLNAEYHGGNALLPVGEVLLSELGREQATLLGKKLCKLGFAGKIYASPLLRTMETAELIAKETGAKIVPTPWMQEIFGDRDIVDTYRGSTIDELKKYYFGISEDASLDYPWWVQEPETHEMVKERVVNGIKKMMEEEREDVLLVGHGASARAAHEFLNLKKGGFIWNCGLGMYDSENLENNFGNDYSHIPEDMVTSNRVKAITLEFNSDYEEIYNIDIPEKLKIAKGTKLLHIGDAHSSSYTYYKQLISAIKPDIIVYTGDTADEVKVGGYPELKDEYIEKVQSFIGALERPDCKSYWVPGNNDLPDEIVKIAPFLEITEPGTVIEVGGVKVSLSHSDPQIVNDADIYLYGHSREAEDFASEKVLKGEDGMCLNALWSSHVCVLPEKELYVFNFPWK